MDDKRVYDMLREKDESYNSWTTEDPSFEEIERIIDEKLKEEKQ